MQLVYFYNLKEQDLSILDSTDSYNDASTKLTEKIQEFIVNEEGKKKGDNWLKETTQDPNEIDDGYFLKKDKATNRYQLYHKKTVVNRGYLSSSVEAVVEHIGYYSIIEFHGAQAMEIVTQNIAPVKSLVPKIGENILRDALIKELKCALDLRRGKFMEECS